MTSKTAPVSDPGLSFDPYPYLSVGDYADLYWEDGSSLAIRWERGKGERVTGGRESGAGLRYLYGDENRYGYADNPDGEMIAKLFRDLTGQRIPRANGSTPPAPPRFFRPPLLKPVMHISPDDKVALLRKAYAAAHG